jgi:hypothetical protein
MNTKIHASILVCFLFMTVAEAQTKWTVNDKYILYNGEPVFLNGANYVPSVNWQTCLETWDAASINQDFVALEKLNVKCIRWFPLWPYIQPKPDKIDEKYLGRIVELFDLAQKHNIAVQLSFFSGWMSGFTFLPEWADGNVFTNPEIIKGEKFLIKTLTAKLKNHPALQGYDFGNEMNVLVDKMNLKVTPNQIDEWMQQIYLTIHNSDPEHPVTNGIGTGFDQYFTTDAISRSCDFMSNHSYPVFHRTLMLDPKIGQRTTYSSNFITSWCKMEGKPVLIQEIGSSEGEQHISEIAKFLRITLMSNWADGAAGYFWWCSNDIRPDYQVPEKGLYLKYSNQEQLNRKFGRFEETLGLTDIKGNTKISGLEYTNCINIIEKLGFGWVDQTPLIYIMVPEKHVFNNSIIELITPFALLKQNHVTVRLAYENKPVPADASAIVIPAFELSTEGKKNVGEYLNNGGTVYQSYYNDFKKDLLLGIPDTLIKTPLIWLNERTGSMLAVRNYVKTPQMLMKSLNESNNNVVIANLMTGKEKPLDWNTGKGTYVKTKVGKGAYFYFAGNLEKAYETNYNPWLNDDSYELYAAFCPEHEISIDNKMVEFYHKKRGTEEMIILINHDNTFQDVNLLSKRNIGLTSFNSHKEEGSGNYFYFRLKPAEVKILFVQ